MNRIMPRFFAGHFLFPNGLNYSFCFEVDVPWILVVRVK